MFLRKRKNGLYHLCYKNNNGQWTSISTGTKIKNIANRFLSEFLSSKVDRPITKLTFNEFSNIYLDYSKTNHEPSNTIRIQYIFKQFCPYYGETDLTQILPLDIEKYKSARLFLIKPTTLNIELRALRSLFNKAVEWGYLEKSPMNKVKLLPIPETKPVYLTYNEFEKLLTAITLPWLKALIIFAANTGMRRKELVNLKWANISLEDKVLYITNDKTFKTKTKRERVMPLNEISIEVLNSQGRVSEYVFTNTEGKKLTENYVTQCMKIAVMKSGLQKELHFHSLRHTFASWLVMNKVPIYHVSKLLGHTTVKTTEIYSHLCPEELQDAVNTLRNENKHRQR